MDLKDLMYNFHELERRFENENGKFDAEMAADCFRRVNSIFVPSSSQMEKEKRREKDRKDALDKFLELKFLEDNRMFLFKSRRLRSRIRMPTPF